MTNFVFENNSLEDVLLHIRELYCLSSAYLPFITGDKELATLDQSIKEHTQIHIKKANELFSFVKNFVENKTGIIPPKSMVIQHKILRTLLDKCEFDYAANLNYIAISYYMNVCHRNAIEKIENEKPF